LDSVLARPRVTRARPALASNVHAARQTTSAISKLWRAGGLRCETL